MEKDLTLKSFRESRGLTQQALADRLGVAKNYIYLVESGRKPMTEKLRRKLEFFEQAESNHAERLESKSNPASFPIGSLESLESRLDRLEQILLSILAKLS